MTICTIDALGNCNRHRVKHIGRLAQLAVEESERGEKYRQKWDELYGNSSLSKSLLRSLPLAKQCQYFGERLTKEEVNEKKLAGCRQCNGETAAYHCNLPGQKKFNDGPYTRGAECMSCGDWKLPDDSGTVIVPESSLNCPQTIRLDHTNLCPEIPGQYRFNCSIIESGKGYLFTFRTGWSGSRIVLCKLDSHFQPIPKAWEALNLSRNGVVGHEDGRLFRLNGKLHLAFVAYGGRRTRVKFARINEDMMQVEDEFFPQIEPKRHWEKNHSFFDYQGIAHAVYETTNQHRILKIEGNKTEWAAETPFKGNYSGGPIRGGASPVLYDGHWWHFTHGVVVRNGHKVYNIGVTKFSPEPPFNIVAYTPHPIATAADTGNWCIFPCGAVKVRDQWAVSMGVDDKWCEIRFYDHSWVESQLVPHE